MSTSGSEKLQRLNPIYKLPTTGETMLAGDRELRFAEAILSEGWMSMELSGGGRAALAASALYTASAVIHAGGHASQDEVGELMDVAAISIRGWMPEIATVALEIDTSEFTNDAQHDRVVRERLEHLAAGGSVPDMPGF